MTIHFELSALLSVAAGVGILIWPKLLNYIVAGYLIISGVVAMTGLQF